MAEQKRYYLVNPAGAIHEVTKEHAAARLVDARYRMATAAEVEIYRETEVQKFDAPIARPWSPDPDVQPQITYEVEDVPASDATDAARELAEEHGISLVDVEGTGAGGRIVLRDVEKLVKDNA